MKITNRIANNEHNTRQTLPGTHYAYAQTLKKGQPKYCTVLNYEINFSSYVYRLSDLIS